MCVNVERTETDWVPRIESAKIRQEGRAIRTAPDSGTDAGYELDEAEHGANADEQRITIRDLCGRSRGERDCSERST